MGGFQDIINDDTIYAVDDIPTILEVLKTSGGLDIVKNGKKSKVSYYNTPCGFDIETSSFFSNQSEKTAIMYIWTFGIGGYIVQGRTWEEFTRLCNVLSEEMNLSDTLHLLCYCHNFSYEFQFMRKWFEWDKVFAIDERKPVYGVTTVGIEFRCSLILSGYSLAVLGDMLHEYPIRKVVGGLDYSMIRHKTTPLTDLELLYCVNDVKVVMCYIMERIQESGTIAKIPLTKTGYVRNFCREKCMRTPGVPRNRDLKALRFREIITRMNLSPQEYAQLKRAFQGGFTHANAFASGKIITDPVTSYDFTSSYPTVLVGERFPISSSETVKNISESEFEKSLSLYCCLFDIAFFNIRPKIWHENYISVSRCYSKENVVENNGRVVTADKISTTITETDFMIISKFYEWDYMEVSNFRRYKKGYLPTDFVKAVIELYKMKTTLKGVEGQEIKYMRYKEMLNSCYRRNVCN